MTSLTRDIDDYFFPRLDEVANRLGAQPRHMLGVMYSESGVRCTAHNRTGDASGLIQFMPATLRALGWMDGHEAFRRLSATEQLTYVVRHCGDPSYDAGTVDRALQSEDLLREEKPRRGRGRRDR